MLEVYKYYEKKKVTEQHQGFYQCWAKEGQASALAWSGLLTTYRKEVGQAGSRGRAFQAEEMASAKAESWSSPGKFGKQ